jgi:hypothetical protein
MCGLQWPQASQANPSTNAIVLKQGGAEVPHITIYRTDGVNGDGGFNPLYPYKMRGSVDAYGNVITGNNFSNRTYAIDVPIVTNANFDIIARSDASSVNTLVKLDAGIDLNSQMGFGPTNGGVGPTGYDLRDNKPGSATDVFLGYEQTAFQFRNGPEKFAARNIASNTVVSFGAETYYYTVGGTSNVVSGSGYGAGITNQCANWVYHDPLATNTAASPNNTATQRVPLSPTNGQSVDIYLKVGYQFQINTCFIYYTTDGTNPEGAFGTGKGTTQVVQGSWVNHDSAQSNIDWWKCTIPAQANGTQVRYKVGLYYGGNIYSGQSINTIAYSESSGSKLFGLTQSAITNFNPTTAVVWLHGDLNTNSTTIGLQSGFHIIRARTFLPRTGQSSVYNTFSQTFYYDGALPTGTIPYPANSSTITTRTYGVVVRADSTVTGVDFNIQDSNTNNDDIITHQNNGNGNDTNGNPIYVSATAAASPDASLSAQYPNYPQEYRFNYTNVPTSGSATITVRLKEFATSTYSNRYTTLTTTVGTAAPGYVVTVVTPTNNAVFNYSTNQTYAIQTCFDSSLLHTPTDWVILINNNMVPQANYTFINIGNNNAYCSGYRTLKYNWTPTQAGTYVIQAIYTNTLSPISDSAVVTLAPPLTISGLANNNQSLIWSSVSNVNYQVFTTTNLTQPFQPASSIIPGSTPITTYYDQYPAPQKFFRVMQVQ